MMIAPQAKGWLGIDIGTRCVKLAQVVRSGDQVRLLDWAVVAKSRQGDAVGSVSQELLAARSMARRTRGRRAACSPPMTMCSFVMCEIDEATSEPHTEGLARLLGLAADEINLFDFVQAGLGNGPPEAIVAGISECSANQLASDARKVGLRCQVIDAVPFALARALRIGEFDSENEPVAAVDLGSSAVTFCAASAGQVCFVRTLPRCGFDALWEHGNDATRGETLSRVTQEIERTLGYLQSQHPQRMPKSIVLFGGGATIPGVADQLEEALPIPVDVWRLRDETDETTPSCLLGPAIALSALAWSNTP